MKAKAGIVELLNSLLTVELTAVNQYFIQAEMALSWGFNRLHAKLRESSLEEMQDAQRLIRHILYLEGVPDMQRLGLIKVGANVPEHLQLDLDLERSAVDGLAKSIGQCTEAEDFTTRHLLEEMITSEEEQIDWLETQVTLISQVGIENYLSQQISDGA